MGRYSTVYSDIWMDEKFQELSDAEKLAFVYAFTSPVGNQAGFYKLPPAYLGVAIRKEKTEALEILSSLSKKDMLEYDVETETIHIPSYLNYNTAKSTNQFKGLNTCIKALPFTRLHFGFFISLVNYCPDAIQFIDKKILTYIKFRYEDDGSARSKRLQAYINTYLDNI